LLLHAVGAQSFQLLLQLLPNLLLYFLIPAVRLLLLLLLIHATAHCCCYSCRPGGDAPPSAAPGKRERCCVQLNSSAARQMSVGIGCNGVDGVQQTHPDHVMCHVGRLFVCAGS
jgi:hypothetical protein